MHSPPNDFASQGANSYAQKRRLLETTFVPEPESIAAQSPTLLADYLAKYQMKTFSKLSAVELEDIRIPGTQEFYSVLFILKANRPP